MCQWTWSRELFKDFINSNFMKNFDYYIFIDYSKNLIGYNIIKQEKINLLIEKISKFKHYRNLKHKREYLSSIKKIFVREKIEKYFIKTKIKFLRQNLEIYFDIFNFINSNFNCIIFISVDNNQYSSFMKIIKLVKNRNVKIIKESDLKKNSKEYKLSLVIDTLLNLKRMRSKSK